MIFIGIIVSFSTVTGAVAAGESCSDTDGGDNIFVKGTITTNIEGKSVTASDNCAYDNVPEDSTSFRYIESATCSAGTDCYVQELACNWNDSDSPSKYSRTILCPNGCRDGACLQAAGESCSDTDGGVVIDVKGKTGNLISEDFMNDVCFMNDATGTTSTSQCSGINCSIKEYNCNSDGKYVSQDFSCNARGFNGCRDGACFGESASEPSLPPTNPSGKLPPAGYEDEILVNIEAYNNPFPDTSLSSLSGKAAAELYRRAVIGGYPDGEFKGNRDVNRAEAAKFLLLARYGNVDELRNSGRFPDVLDGQWYTKFVVTAADKGIISGNPDGTFRPANTVNTAEFLKMLSLTFGLQLNLFYSYLDVSSHDWFAPYAGIAQKYSLFPGRSSYLYPSDPLTREEIAVAIYQYLQQR
jgi:hypothetical protein